jgi:hypothetical protein
MNRTAAATIAGTVAVLVAALGAAATADSGPTPCQQAVQHADTMAELHHQVVANVAAMDLAIQHRQDTKADQLAGQVETTMDAYTDAHRQYLTASEGCR